jgi:hypothetical protein
MVEVCTGTMAPKNDQQYGCQTGNNLKEKSQMFINITCNKHLVSCHDKNV